MKYYYLTKSINIDEVGCFPQSESAENYSFMSSELSILDIQPIPILKSKAKLTSLLLSVPLSLPKLILDDELLEFLKSFITDKYLYSKIKVRKGNVFFENYNLFVLLSTSEEMIGDFSKSEFYEGNRIDWEYRGGKVILNSYDEYLNFTEQKKDNSSFVLKTTKLHLDFSSINKDFIFIEKFPIISGYLVSEKLKNAIEEKGFTGIAFKEIEEMDNRIKVTY